MLKNDSRAFSDLSKTREEKLFRAIRSFGFRSIALASSIRVIYRRVCIFLLLDGGESMVKPRCNERKYFYETMEYGSFSNADTICLSDSDVRTYCMCVSLFAFTDNGFDASSAANSHETCRGVEKIKQNTPQDPAILYISRPSGYAMRGDYAEPAPRIYFIGIRTPVSAASKRKPYPDSLASSAL